MFRRCCHHLLPIATLLLGLTVTSAIFSGWDDIILRPHNPEVVDGQWLTLNCTILPRYSGSYTNLDLYFTHAKVNYTNTSLVGDRTALFRKQWSITEGGGHIWCTLPDRPQLFTATQTITIVREPLQPTITHCVLLNWRYMNCTWQPSSVDQQEHTHSDHPLIQSVQYTLGSNEWHDAVCRGEVIDSCVWNISHIVTQLSKSENCCVNVTAKLHLHHLRFDVQSPSFCFHPVNNVVLDQPRSVTTDSKSTREVSVTWQPPLLDLSHPSVNNLLYAVTLTSQWNDEPLINQIVVNRSLSFTTIPHTHYTVAIKVKTVDSQFWSKSTIHTVTTASTVPRMSPSSSPSAFTVTHVERYIRNVTVYWQTLSARDHYGPSLRYVILERKPPALHWNELSVVRLANQPYKEVVIDKNSDTELTVIARNEIGDTLPDVVMRLPAVQLAEKSPFAELLVEIADDSTVVWSWRLQTSEDNSDMTLFWCHSQYPHGRCMESIHWLDITASSSSQYNLTISDSNTAGYSYGAALAASGVHRKGIEWASCFYNLTGFAEPVNRLQAVVPSSGEIGQLLVTWNLPVCDVRHGHIKSLLLYCCRYSGSECVDDPKQVSLPGNVTVYRLTGLQHGQEYGIWVYSWTHAGQSLTHSNVATAVVAVSFLTPAVIAGIAVSAVFILVMTAAVVWMLCKYCRRCHAKLWSPMTITVPSPTTPTSPNTALSAPIVEYSRISYTRQGSRLSSSSHDSGQFGISGSPLLTPKSCGESVVIPLMAGDSHTVPQQPSPVRRDRVRTPPATYMNSDIVTPHRTTHNHAECIPLQPILPHHTHDSKLPTSDADPEDANIPEVPAIDGQPNGGYNAIAVRPSSDYIPHKWLKM